MDNQIYNSQQPIATESQQYMHHRYKYVNGDKPPLPPEPRKKWNILAMIGLGLILLSILVFMVAPEISIYAWIFGMAFSIVGLFFKPRWMAVIGSIISSIPLLIFLLVVLILNNPGPPSAEDLQRSREVREGVTEEVFDDDVVVDEDSLLLNPIEVDEIGANGPTQQQ